MRVIQLLKRKGESKTMRKSTVIAALLSIMSTTASAKDQFSFQTVAVSGKWYAAKTLKNGKLDSCSLKSIIKEKFEGEGDTAEYKTVVSIVYGRYEPGMFRLGIDSNADQYDMGSKFDVAYSFDDGYYWREMADPLQDTVLSIPVSIYNSINFLDTIKYSKEMHVKNITSDKMYNFDMTGVQDVYGSFTGCMQEIMAKS